MALSRKLLCLILVTLLALLYASPTIASGATGWLTPEAPYITLDPGVPNGSSVTAIISSGEMLGDFRFEGIPDGIGLAPGDAPNTVDVYVAHEQTTVPFFGVADFQDASVSKLTLSTIDASVLEASVAIDPSLGYVRFCSAFMAGPDEGFSDYTFFVGEESNDIVDVPAGAPYGADPSLDGQRQAGFVVALNTATGESVPIPGMGRLNHENNVVVPGDWNQFAMLTTDDTFSATTSQLYLYLANHESHITDDKGGLWAFRVTRTNDGPVNPNDPFNDANDYLDLEVGDDYDWQGEFIRVPRRIAEGTTGLPPQDALEQWSNENNIFQFVRLEDLAYDLHNPRIVYIADTGATRVVPDPLTGRMQRGPSGTVGMADNGRVFRLEFNENNPRKVDSFSVMAQGDNPTGGLYVPFRSPDNMDTSANSLMLQEDADDGKIWQYDFASEKWSAVATVNKPVGESSGIVDASAWFGAGAWLLDVQDHGAAVDLEFLPNGTILKREAGQLMLMIIPGS